MTIPECSNLVDDEDSHLLLQGNDKVTKNKDIMKILAKVLKKTVEETNDSRSILRKVEERLTNDEIIGKRLEHEFLSLISFEIQRAVQKTRLARSDHNSTFNMYSSAEQKEFNRYAEHLVGGPRKITQLINSYQVARYIASSVNRAGGGEVSREKLLKFVILLG